MWYLLWTILILWGSVANAYDEETERIKKEIEDTICKTSFSCLYQRNVVAKFTTLLERVEREQKENQTKWEKETEDQGSLVPFPY